MYFKKIIKYSLSSLLATAPLMTIIGCSNEYNDLIDKINKKETFIAYFGIKNCPNCLKASKQWDLWMQETQWDNEVKLDAKSEDANLEVKRYSYSADYNFTKKDAPLTIYQQSSKGIRLIFEWIQNQQKELWKNNPDIQKIVNDEYLPDAIPLFLFVKNGQYRWFIMGWGDEKKPSKNDLKRDTEEFKTSPSYNTSTFNKLVSDFIFKDFSNFYKIGS